MSKLIGDSPGMESTDSTSGGSSQQQQHHHQMLAQKQLPPPQPQLPPGFRFHPTDEELVVHYLKRKAASIALPVAIIADVDLYKFDPWELPGKATFGEQEWYFFSPRDRKYPNGARPNRAATSGYWKATGTDKPILSSIDAAGGQKKKVGVKKALVFYGGKPPKGIKTNWIMHEYRLADSSTNTKPPHLQPPTPASAHAPMSSAAGKKASLRLDDWVLCRIYKKNSSSSNCMQRPLMLVEHGGNDDHSVSIDNELSVSTAQASLLHLRATATTISRLHQPQPQHKRFAAAANYSSALLDSDDTFFHGFLSNNTEQDQADGVNSAHTNSVTCNYTIQLAGSPHFQSKHEHTSAPAYWCNADAVVGNLNHQPSPFNRFQVYNNDDGNNSGGCIVENINNTNNNSSNVICNSSGTNSNSTDHADDDGRTIQNMLRQQIPQSSTVAANEYQQQLLLGSLGDGPNPTVFRQVPYQLLSGMGAGGLVPSRSWDSN